MGDKTLTESLDDFFDIRSLAAVLLGFVLLEWFKAIVMIYAGADLEALLIIWPIVFLILIIILANAGRKTNGKLKRDDFEKRINELEDKIK